MTTAQLSCLGTMPGDRTDPDETNLTSRQHDIEANVRIGMSAARGD